MTKRRTGSLDKAYSKTRFSPTGLQMRANSGNAGLCCGSSRTQNRRDRHHRIEMIVWKRRVQGLDRLDGDTEPRMPPAGAGQHMGAEIDTDHRGAMRVERQVAAGAHTRAERGSDQASAALNSTGRPASLHSGSPSSSRHAVKPLRRSFATAS